MNIKSSKLLKSNIRKTYILEGLVALLIIVIPFTLFAHLLFDNTDASLKILSFEYDHGFDGTRVFIWFVLVLLIAITLLIIWYWECNYRWDWLILLSIIPWIDTASRFTFYTSGVVEDYIVYFSISFFSKFKL